ncbi:hypothetical protein LJR296_001715 [Cupriavidus necator]|jgi:hypothetical protein|uniref:hypothetical protein n=1 Tax=Cupriavidus necator TaxID=106590 RepID=UPI003ED087E9
MIVGNHSGSFGAHRLEAEWSRTIFSVSFRTVDKTAERLTALAAAQIVRVGQDCRIVYLVRGRGVCHRSRSSAGRKRGIMMR